MFSLLILRILFTIVSFSLQLICFSCCEYSFTRVFLFFSHIYLSLSIQVKCNVLLTFHIYSLSKNLSFHFLPGGTLSFPVAAVWNFPHHHDPGEFLNSTSSWVDNIPDQESNPGSWQWKHWVPTTGLPGNFQFTLALKPLFPGFHVFISIGLLHFGGHRLQ